MLAPSILSSHLKLNVYFLEWPKNWPQLLEWTLLTAINQNISSDLVDLASTSSFKHFPLSHHRLYFSGEAPLY